MKIAFIFPDDFTVWHFYKSLLKILRERGLDVYAISGGGGNYAGDYESLIRSLGVNFIAVKIYRFLSPLQDLRLLFQLYKIFRHDQFDIVHGFYLKPIIYGSIAAKMSGVKNIYGTFEGMGVTFSQESGLKLRLLKPLIVQLIRFSCRLCNRLWFTNKNDLSYFISKGIVNSRKVILTKNAINTEYFSPSSVQEHKIMKLRKEFGFGVQDKVVVMVARMIWAKGIKQFIEASEIIKEKYPHVKFLLLAPLEPGSPQSVPETYVKEKEKSGNFLWLGFRKDVREIYALSNIAVLPSYYKEGGYPRALLEPMGMARPIITTNSPDCRGPVEEGKNGYLVPVKDSKALANAIEKLVTNDRKREELGRYSRIKAEREFDEKLVINKVMTELYGLNL